MKKFSYLAGAAFLAISATSSFAAISISYTEYTGAQLATISGDPTLGNNGWVGYLLTLHATGGSTGISAVDFQNVTGYPGMPTSNIGIAGAIHQEWSIAKGDGSNSALATSTPDDSTEGLDGLDSFWYGASAGLGTVSGHPAVEDNNLVSGVASNPPYTGSPEANIAATSKNLGYAYGVGSLMQEAGSYTSVPASANLAFVIVPANQTTTINGVAVDQAVGDWAIQLTLPAVPEPASLGLLAVGGLALLGRRRRKA